MYLYLIVVGKYVMGQVVNGVHVIVGQLDNLETTGWWVLTNPGLASARYRTQPLYTTYFAIES